MHALDHPGEFGELLIHPRDLGLVPGRERGLRVGSQRSEGIFDLSYGSRERQGKVVEFSRDRAASRSERPAARANESPNDIVLSGSEVVPAAGASYFASNSRSILARSKPMTVSPLI